MSNRIALAVLCSALAGACTSDSNPTGAAGAAGAQMPRTIVMPAETKLPTKPTGIVMPIEQKAIQTDIRAIKMPPV